MNTALAMICGTDLPFVDAGLTIHQPSIKEISYIGEEDFFTGAQCFCIDKNLFTQDETVLSKITNFQIFMTVMNEKEAQDKKNAVIQFLSLLFPSYKISFTPRSILLMNKESSGTIDENTFDSFQELVKEICCLKSDIADQKILNPADERARQIAEKIMKGRQRLAEQRNKDGQSIFTQYLSTLSVGLQMSLLDLMKLTMYQLYDLMQRYMLYIDWDIDIRSRLAGGKPNKPVENWMKNIH